jgi:hypothetical protein
LETKDVKHEATKDEETIDNKWNENKASLLDKEKDILSRMMQVKKRKLKS